MSLHKDSILYTLILLGKVGLLFGGFVTGYLIFCGWGD